MGLDIEEYIFCESCNKVTYHYLVEETESEESTVTFYYKHKCSECGNEITKYE